MRLNKATLAALLASAAISAWSQQKIAPKDAVALLGSGAKVVLLDVRTAEEHLELRIPGSVLLPYDRIDARSAAQAIPSKDSTVIVYCRSGRRSAIAASALAKLGYRKVLDLGGIADWPYETAKGPL